MRHRLYRLILVCFLLIISPLHAAQLDAQLNRQTMGQGETVTLTLTVQGQASPSTQPDLSPLEKDFSVLGTSTSRRINMVNGKTTSVTQWVITLSPKITGKITVPEISAGKYKSAPVSLTVNTMNQLKASGQTPAIFMEASIEPKQVLLQAQVRYILKVFHSVDLVNPSLQGPESDNAYIKLAKENINYKKNINGKTYRVVELHYLIFPQTPGTLKINAPVLSGNVAVPRNTNSIFDQFTSARRPVRVIGPTKNLAVLPKPSTAAGQWWLPARNLTLQQAWSNQPATFRVGEPVTRTLTLTATGVSSEQLPELHPQHINHFTLYPDKATTSETIRAGNLVSSRTEKIAYIPQQPGDITLPAIRVSWWNVQTQRAEFATLPASTIHVQPAANPQNNAAVNTVQPSVANHPPLPGQPIPHNNRSTRNKLHISFDSGFWPWFSLFLGVAWLVTMLLWWRQSRRQNNAMHRVADKPVKVSQLNTNTINRTLKQACQANDAQQAQAALLLWANSTWPQLSIRNLGRLARQPLTPAFRAAIIALEKYLYRDVNADTTPWQGTQLWQSFLPNISKPENRNGGSGSQGLPPLTPTGK